MHSKSFLTIFRFKGRLELAEKSEEVATIIMAGGEGKRLFPLTLNHCKPAVPFGGRYRLIDIPISNSIHANLRKIFVLGQYLTAELEHHLRQSYHFDPFSPGSLDFLTPEVRTGGEKIWFEGTADSVRKCLSTLRKCSVEYFLILSGDQLYNMNFIKMIEFAKKKEADLTVATIAVSEEEVSRLGIMKVNKESRIEDFLEKPQDFRRLNSFILPGNLRKNYNGERDKKLKYLASMGIYIFKREALFRLLQEDSREDFGKHLIPKQVEKKNSFAYIYDGYWEDIGTIASFYKANLALTKKSCGLDTYDDTRPIFTRPSFLSGPKIKEAKIINSILCEGSVIEAREISDSVIGMRSYIKKGTTIKESITLGSHFYLPEKPEDKRSFPTLHIGENCEIKKAILDENVHLGNGVKLINKGKKQTYDGEGVFIRDGIIIVTAGTSLPDGFVL